jgi:4-carboxymuconolactone decarboxylase
MRLTQPRIQPVAIEDLTPQQREIVGPRFINGRLLNIYRTMIVAPEAAQGFLAWGRYILSAHSSLSSREREIVILRTGYLCRSGYEWTQHKRIALGIGMTEEERARVALQSVLTADEVERIKLGSAAAGWAPEDAALLKAAEELHQDQFICDATWAALRGHFSERQCMDVVFTAGQYTQVCMILNTFGVQLDPGQTLDPDLALRGV